MNLIALKPNNTHITPELSISYKSPNRFDNLIKSIPDAVITTDSTFKIISTNEIAEELYAIQQSNIIGKNIFDVIEKSDIIGTHSLQSVTESLHTNGLWSSNIVKDTHLNQNAHFRTHCSAIKNEEGLLSGYIFIRSNVLRKVENKKRLSSVENKYETLVQSLNEGIMVIDNNGIINTINKKAAEIFRLEENEIIGQKISSPANKVFRDDGTEYPPSEFPIAMTLETGVEIRNITMGVQHADGGIIWITLNSKGLFRNASNKPYAAVISFTDVTKIKEVNKQLNQTETLFSAFIEKSLTASWIYDEDGYILFANDIYNKLAPSLSNTVGEHILDVFPIDGAKIVERNKEFLKTQEPLITECSITMADGSIRYFLCFLFSINIHTEKKLIGGQAIDITDEKLSFEKQRESEILFSAFVHNTRTANWIYDDEGTIVLANKLYDENTNYGTSTEGKKIKDIFSDDYAKKIIERNNNIIETGVPVIFESSLPHADGSIRDYISYLFVIDIPGKKRMIGGQSIDVTEQNIAAKNLKNSEILFKGFMNNSQNLGWVYDEKDTLIYGNPLFMETVGLSEQDLGKNIYDITTKEIADTILEKTKKVLTTEEVLVSEDIFIDKNGVIKYFIAHYFLLPFGDNQKLVGGHALDITERKNMEAALTAEKIRKQLQINQATIIAQEKERNRLSEELHDNVNQLLVSTKLHIGAIKKQPENQHELLEKASKYLMMAIEEIRDLSKSLNSNIIISVGLEKSIREIASNLKKLNAVSVSLEVDDEAIKKLTQDQCQMVYRIIQEQTTNIVKYSGASKAAIYLKNGIGNLCNLIISDNGNGFDKEHQNSKGIGFVNIFNRVNAYNGTVEITTSIGNGCELYINFPYSGDFLSNNFYHI